MKSTHNAATFKPYDPAEAIGDTSPTTPKPPKHNKCGAFGQVLLVVVAAVVAFATQQYWLTADMLKTAGFGAASGALSGAAAGAAGSIASQAVGVAFNIQEKFSWNGVAMAAIGGGISGGSAAKFGAGKNALHAAIRGAGNSIATQGVNMAFGLQKKFSWAGVASAGVGAGVSRFVGEQMGVRYEQSPISGKWVQDSNTPLTWGQNIGMNTASALAATATRTAISGGSFGDNFRAEIPNIIGNIISTATIDALRECFVAGTPVHTPDGLRPIETIRAGDLVWARDDRFSDPQVRARRVRQVFATPDRAYMRLTVALADGREETLQVTPAHPFAVPEGGWVEAQNLPAGAAIVTRSGDPARVIRAEAAAELETVYNFEVEEDHTYFVGGLGVWVHNDSKAERAFEAARRKAEQEGRYAPEYQISDSEYLEDQMVHDWVDVSGRRHRTTAFPKLGKFLEAYVKHHDPDFELREPARAQAVRRATTFTNAPLSDFRYEEGYINYLADVAAQIHDGLFGSGYKPPPLYERTGIGAISWAFDAGDGSGARIAAALPSGAAPGRIVVEEWRSGAELTGRTPLPLTRSGFASWEALSEALGQVYQQAVTEADKRYTALVEAGRDPYRNTKIPENFRRGVFVDRASIRSLRVWLAYENIPEGRIENVWINRRVYDPGGTGLFRRPDVFVRPPGDVYDASVAVKTISTPQVRDTAAFTGANRIVSVMPERLGGNQVIYSRPPLPTGTGHNSQYGMPDFTPPAPRNRTRR